MPVRNIARLGLISLLASLSAGAQQITGQVVGTTGASVSARFGILGSVGLVGQVPSSGGRFSIAPLAPKQRDPIFGNNFEQGVP